MPSRVKTSDTTVLTSGSSATRMRSAASSSVTCEPKRWKTWASSEPMAPAPMTARVPGAAVTFTTSRFVQYGVSANPSIGGAVGCVPVASTMPERARTCCPPTSTRPSPTSRAWAWTMVAPFSQRRSTTTVSSQPWVASERMRSATGPKSGVTLLSPATSWTSRASARAPAARIIILLGTQP